MAGSSGGANAGAAHSGAGIEWSPAVLSDGRVALFHSDARMPARAALLESSGGVRDLAPSDDSRGFSRSRARRTTACDVSRQRMACVCTDSCSCHPGGGPGKHAAVVFFHGGSRRQMLLGWHYMQYYNQAYGFNQYLASKGYVVLSVNYRSGIGYGSDFREAPTFRRDGRERVQRRAGRRRLSARPARCRPRPDRRRGVVPTAAT